MRGLRVCVMAALGASWSGPAQAQDPGAADARISFYQHVAWSNDGRLLATSVMTIARAAWEREQFRALQSGQFDVHVIPVDGSPVLVTGDATTNDMWATWWPGHRCILYSADRPDGTSALHFARADGTDDQTVLGLQRQVSQASVSPDGNNVAFVSREGPERHIFVVKTSGGAAPVRLTSAGPSNQTPVWSPDGRRIVFFSKRQGSAHDHIFVVNADGSGEQQLTFGNFHNMFPSWSADGERIVFTSDRDGRGREGIFVMNADGSNISRLLPTLRAGFARWSPNGRRLAIIAGEFPDTRIYIAGADGSNPVRLTR